MHAAKIEATVKAAATLANARAWLKDSDKFRFAFDALGCFQSTADRFAGEAVADLEGRFMSILDAAGICTACGHQAKHAAACPVAMFR